MNTVALVVLLTSIAAAQTPAVDWDKQKAETLAHYRALIQIDSSSPPGNETRVVEYLTYSTHVPRCLPRPTQAFVRRARMPGP